MRPDIRKQRFEAIGAAGDGEENDGSELQRTEFARSTNPATCVQWIWHWVHGHKNSIYWNMPNLKKYPFYLRSTVILFGLILFSYALANLRGILIPFSFALFLAILLNPLVEKLEQWKLPKVAAILLALAVAIVIIAGIWYFLATQMMHFTSQLPALQRKTDQLVSHIQQD